MIRLAHTLMLALLVAVALISYGLKEEHRARTESLSNLLRQKEELRQEIATLKTEWHHLSSPEHLRRIAQRLYGGDGMRTANGALLSAWQPDQLLDLHAPVPRPSLHEELKNQFGEDAKDLLANDRLAEDRLAKDRLAKDLLASGTAAIETGSTPVLSQHSAGDVF